MKRSTNIVLMIIIAVLTVLSIPGAAQRLKNENRSKTINIVADYTSFKLAADKIKKDVFDLIDEFGEYGMATIMVSNKTIRDYQEEGKVAISYVYEIRNRIIAEGVVADTSGSLNNSLFLVPDDGYYEFVLDKLSKRFRNEAVILTEYNGQKAIILNAELDERVGVNMGFDENVISAALQKGYKVALSMQNENFGNTAFLEEIAYLFDTYDISYVEINSFEFPGYGEGFERAAEIIKNSGAVLMLKADYGIVNPNITKGLYDYLYESDFRLHRTFFIKDYIPNQLITTPNDYYLRMLRAAVDRGNRFFVISPLTHVRKTFSQAVTDTRITVKLFYNRLKGSYDFDGVVDAISFEQTHPIYQYFSALAIIFALLLLLINSFPRARILYWLYGVFVVFYLAFGFLYERYLGRVNALMGTLVFPSLFALLLAREITGRGGKSTLRFLLNVFTGFFGTALICIMTSVINLSSVYNFIGINSFAGVKLSFVIPVAAYIIVYFANGGGMRVIAEKTALLGRRPVTYISLALIAIAGIAGYIYIARSGNESGNLVGSFEIVVREFFEDFVLARPRNKEFLIGYPALALVAYMYHKKAKDIVLFIFGSGVMVGLISLINTFSHVNAYVGVSVSRSLYGLVFGAIISAALLAVIYYAEKAAVKYFKGNVNG